MARPEPLTSPLTVKFGQSKKAEVVSCLALPRHINLIGERSFTQPVKPRLNLLIPRKTDLFASVYR